MVWWFLVVLVVPCGAVGLVVSSGPCVILCDLLWWSRGGSDLLWAFLFSWGHDGFHDQLPLDIPRRLAAVRFEVIHHEALGIYITSVRSNT